MPTFRSPPLVWLALLPPPSSLAQAARARLPAISSAAVFIIRAPRKTSSSLEGRAVPLGRAPRDIRGSAPSPRAACGRAAGRHVDDDASALTTNVAGGSMLVHGRTREGKTPLR